MITLLALAAGYRVSPVLFAGTADPTVDLTPEQDAELDRLLEGFGRPAPTSVTVGYRGFRVQQAPLPARYVRGEQAAELFLLKQFDLPAHVRAYVEQEIRRDHAGELSLADESPAVPGPEVDCSHVVGPDTPPVYDPKTDDKGCYLSEQGENNCYNYASDIVTDTFAQPGRGSGKKWTANTCQNINASALRDGLVWHGTDLPAGPPAKGHFVALLIWPGTNFHWIRMDASKYWSHKPGGTPVRNTDNNGKKITDPSKSDFSPWTQFCGFLQVVPSALSINEASPILV